MDKIGHKKIVMVGVDVDAKGGIASVIQVYKSAGLFDQFPIVYITDHSIGNVFAKIFSMNNSYTQFIWLLLTGRVGLLHAHVASRISFWRKSVFFMLAFIFKVPSILHLHGGEFMLFYHNECGILRKWYVRHIFNNATRIVVLSSTWKTWVQGISDNPHVDVIFNPVLLPGNAYTEKARRLGSVLFLAHINARKGINDLLEATAKVAIDHPEIRLFIGGDGEIQKARERAIELGIDNRVEFLGWIKGADKVHYLAEAVVFVLPSYNEGLPMSVLEAMAMGLPILSTNIGGIPEAVKDGVEGFIVEPGDVNTLAAKLCQLLDDPALARRMGEAAKHKVETTFASNVTLAQLKRLYGEIGFHEV